MTNYFKSEEINSVLSNLSIKLTDKANVANLYPILKKATSSSEHPTPGYVYQVLIEFSYESKDNCTHLVQYLNKRLQRPSAYGVLKTLKTMKHLTEKGSREFRKGMRENDEHIKSAPDYGSQHDSFTGTDILEQIRQLSKNLLLDLFSEESISRDSDEAPEVVPTFNQNLAGMGNTTTKMGKYEGFGNSPINKNSMTDRVRDVIESVINLPDPKKQIMDLCLEDSTGDYEAIHLPSVGLAQVKQKNVVIDKPKTHIPGRAGGGWEDSSDEDASILGDYESMQLSGDGHEECENTLTNSAEFAIVEEFCQNNDKPNNLSAIMASVKKLAESETLNGVFCIIHVLETGDEGKQYRALLLLEHLINEGIVSPAKVQTVFCKPFASLEISQNEPVALKAQKIKLILDALKSIKSS